MTIETTRELDEVYDVDSFKFSSLIVYIIQN